MSVVLGVVRRNLRLFFRDRLNVFFSLLSAVILFVLYTLFLARLQVTGLEQIFPDAPSAQISAFVDSWMFAGILMLSTVTTSMGALSVLVDDRQSGRFADALVSPVRRGQLVVGYLASAAVVAVLMSVIVLVISILYLGLLDGLWLGAAAIIRLAGLTVLCCVAFTALSAFLLSFISTNGAFSAFATIVGTALGFLAGAYIPVGSLPEAVADVINALPFGQAAMLMRREFSVDALATVAGGNAELVDGVATSYGVDAYVGDWLVSPVFAVGLLVAMMVVFTALSGLRIRSLIR